MDIVLALAEFFGWDDRWTKTSKDTDGITDLSDSYLQGEERKMDVDEGGL